MNLLRPNRPAGRGRLRTRPRRTNPGGQVQDNPFANITSARFGTVTPQQVLEQQQQQVAQQAAEYRAANTQTGFRKLCWTPYVQWADFVTAEAWMRKARELTTEARQAELQSRPFSEQSRAVFQAWQAIGNAYRAMDLRPVADPIYVGWTQWMIADQVHDINTLSPARTGDLVNRAKALWAQVGRNPGDDEINCGIEQRIGLNGDTGEVMPGSPVPAIENYQFVFGQYHDCAKVGANHTGCEGPYDWNVMYWDWPPGFGTPADPCAGRLAMSPPLVWFFEYARDLSHWVFGDAPSAAAVLERSRASVTANNLETLDAVNQEALRKNPAATTATMSQLLLASRDWRQQLRSETAAERKAAVERAAAISAAMGAAAAATAPIPIVGPLAIAGVAIFSALLTTVSALAAVGARTDRLNRVYPHFEIASISGGPDTVNQTTGQVQENPPTHPLPGMPDNPSIDVPGYGNWAACPAGMPAFENLDSSTIRRNAGNSTTPNRTLEKSGPTLPTGPRKPARPWGTYAIVGGATVVGLAAIYYIVRSLSGGGGSASSRGRRRRRR